jgi:Na+-transporting NADH:ubiquinone oxidoreductase subunit C
MSLTQRSNTEVITFIVILSVICATILASLSSALQEPKEMAKNMDRNKQMMIAAKIINHEGIFLITDSKGNSVPASYAQKGLLKEDPKAQPATTKEIMEVFDYRTKAMLIDSKGALVSFKDAGLDENEYLSSNKKSGYSKLKYKLIYEIFPNEPEADKKKPIGYVIPVNGFGLWDAIYGYLAIKPDGNTVIGTSWYDQKETPGLGANIAEAYWQNLFPGKQIFQAGPSGDVNFKSSPVGIVVVKGKVSEVIGDAPKSKSAVDGMAGATLTGNGVTDAYRDVLSAYRPFLIQLNEKKG